jgi:DNA-binding transcriptional LysR family regulator
MKELDLRLLKVFDEIYKTRSVSRAAENAGVTQPSVSIALAKLRKHFQDPLFVRTSAGMQPTPYATALIRPVRDGLGLLDGALRHRVTFDPTRSDRAFCLCLTDISQAVLLPTLLNHLKRIATGIQLEIVPISSDTPRMLESGDADLAIGFMPQLEAGFYQQKLFQQRFVCAVREDHPRIRSRLSLKQFIEEDHVVVTTDVTGHWIVDKALEERRVARKISVRLPDFLGLAAIVAGTDLLVTVPERLGDVLRRAAKIKVLGPPVELPTYLVKQHWHERYHHDAANRWLRGVVAELFLE